MKLKTRVEVVVLLVGAVVVGGWMGLRLTRPSVKADKPQDISQTPVARQYQGGTSGERTLPLAAIEAEQQQPPAEEALPPKETPNELPSGPTLQDDPQWDTAAAIEHAAKLIAEGKKFEARGMLTNLILTAAEGPQRARMKGMLDEINRELFFSRLPSKDCVFYTVQPGDTLSGISKKYDKDLYFTRTIMLLNSIHDERRIQPKHNLKIPVGRFSALVQKRAYRLIIFLNGHYIKEYRVGLGAQRNPTPVAELTVAVKQPNPAWTTPDGHVYKFGDPRNILGTRWLGFKATKQYQGYGIHGTSDPKAVGKNISSGCVRMLNADIEEIFGMLMIDDSVKIVE